MSGPFASLPRPRVQMDFSLEPTVEATRDNEWIPPRGALSHEGPSPLLNLARVHVDIHGSQSLSPGDLMPGPANVPQKDGYAYFSTEETEAPGVQELIQTPPFILLSSSSEWL